MEKIQDLNNLKAGIRETAKQATEIYCTACMARREYHTDIMQGHEQYSRGNLLIMLKHDLLYIKIIC
jgi:hypothetical protein